MAGKRGADDGPDPLLSERQQQILDFIHAYTERHGVSPSFKEIGDAVGLKSSSGVKHQIEQLQRKGYVTRRDRTPRSIVLVALCAVASQDMAFSKRRAAGAGPQTICP